MKFLKELHEAEGIEIEDTWLRLEGEIKTLRAYIPDLPKSMEDIKSHRTQGKHLLGAYITLDKILKLKHKLESMGEM